MDSGAKINLKTVNMFLKGTLQDQNNVLSFIYFSDLWEICHAQDLVLVKCWTI